MKKKRAGKKAGKRPEEHPIIKEKKHQARRRSIKEGIFATAQYSFGNTYISPFAIAINTSNALIAMMSSIGGLLGPLSQLFSSRLIEKHPRKQIVLHAVFWESIMWIPFIIIGLLFYKGIITNILPLFVVLFFSMHIIIANIAGPAWFSWVGDIVDEQYRGRWFAKRNLIHGFVSIILALGAAFFLDYLKKQGWAIFGFMMLFGLAMVSRLLSWHFFKGQYEPKLKMKRGDYFSFWDFLKKAPKNNFGRFAIFRGFLSFAQHIAVPFFTIYLLRNLGLTYSIYMVITLAGSFSSIMLLNLWGKFADIYGNYRTLLISAFFVPLIPILWMLSKNPLYLILVPSMIGGAAWAGFNLAAGNFIYDNVSPQKRGLVVSYYNMIFGIGAFLGAALGALLIKYIPDGSLMPIFIIFTISGLARMIVVVIGLHKVKEIRKTEKFEGKRAFRNLVIKQGRQAIGEEIHQIASIKNYIFEREK